VVQESPFGIFDITGMQDIDRDFRHQIRQEAAGDRGHVKCAAGSDEDQSPQPLEATAESAAQ
jgi:hypothetical protein